VLATHPATVSRRGALVTGAVLLTAGCDLDPRTSEPVEPAPTSGAPTTTDEDSDLALLDDVRAAVAQALTTVLATRQGVPRLRTALGPLAAMHRAHLAALDGAASPAPAASRPPPVVTGDPAAALGGVRRLETRLQRRCADASVSAGSGELARLLAALSASVAQHLARLPEGPGTPQ
jgi:hypothetical protein